MNSLDHNNLLVFKSISDFVSDLNEVYGKRHKPLALYNRLLSKTTLGDVSCIMKHIEAFRTFCSQNREGILEKDKAKLINHKIIYSERVYINMHCLLAFESSEEVWKHLLYLSALLDPQSKAKDVLIKSKENEKEPENEFFTDLMTKVEKVVDPNANPNEALSSIMSSGLLTEMIGSLQTNMSSGKMDMGKLLGGVQGMISKLGAESGGDPQIQNTVNMLNGVVSGLGNGQQPDMMGLMATMMAGLNTNPK